MFSIVGLSLIVCEVRPQRASPVSSNPQDSSDEDQFPVEGCWTKTVRFFLGVDRRGVVVGSLGG